MTDTPTPQLRAALRYQTAPGIHTWAVGECGHPARGGRTCEGCLRKELERRGVEAKAKGAKR